MYALTLAISPLRQAIKQPALVRLRRMCGLFTFFYAVLHALSWAWWDQGFVVDDMLVDIWKRPFILVGVAFGLFALHTIEIWGYAILFYAIGATQTFEAALYYSTATYSTIGYGDVVLDHNWRILGAIEGGNGVILLGWSTAFFVSVVARMRTLEHDWMGSDAIVHPHSTGPSRD
jgi:hypothetical protein